MYSQLGLISGSYVLVTGAYLRIRPSTGQIHVAMISGLGVGGGSCICLLLRDKMSL